jgi:hypothetical protein
MKPNLSIRERGERSRVRMFDMVLAVLTIISWGRSGRFDGGAGPANYGLEREERRQQEFTARLGQVLVGERAFEGLRHRPTRGVAIVCAHGVKRMAFMDLCVSDEIPVSFRHLL